MAQGHHHHPSNASYKLETRPTFFIPGITGDPRWQADEEQAAAVAAATAAATAQQQRAQQQQQQRAQQQQQRAQGVPQVPPIVQNRRSIRDLLLTPTNTAALRAARATTTAGGEGGATSTPVRTTPLQAAAAALTSPEHGVQSPWHFLPIQESPNMRRKRQMRRQQAKVQRVQRTIVGKESRRRERRKQERTNMLEKQPETIQEGREVSSDDGNDDEDEQKQHQNHQKQQQHPHPNDERYERSYLDQKKDLQPATTFTGTAAVSTSYYGDYKAAVLAEEEPDTPTTQTSWAQDIADTPVTNDAVTTRAAARLPTSRDFDRLAGMLNQISNKFTKENSVAHSFSSRSSIDADIEKSPQRPIISTHYQVPVSPLTEELSVPFTSVSSSEQEELESHTDYLVQEDLDGFDEDKFRQIEIRRAICFQIRRSLVRKDIWNHLQAFRQNKEERQIQIQTRLLRLKLDENKRKLQQLSSRRRKGGGSSGDGWSTPEVVSDIGVCEDAASSPVTPKTSFSTTPEQQQPTPPSRESGDERLKPVPRNPLRPALEQEATPPSRDLSSSYSQGGMSELSGSTRTSAFSPSELTSGSDSTYSSGQNNDEEEEEHDGDDDGSGSTYSSGSGLTPSHTTHEDEDDFTSHADEYTTQSGSFCEDYDVVSREDYNSQAEYTTQTGDYTTQTGESGVGDDDDLISDYDDGVYSRDNASRANYTTHSGLTSDPESYAIVEEDPSTWSPSSLDESSMRRQRQIMERLEQRREDAAKLSPIILPSASKESRIEPPTTPHREYAKRRIRTLRSPGPRVDSSPDSMDSNERKALKRQIALDLDAEEAMLKMQEEEAVVVQQGRGLVRSSSTFRPRVIQPTMTMTRRGDMVTTISTQNESGIRMRQIEPIQKESPSTLFEKRLDRVIKRQEGVRKQNSSIGHKLQILGISPPNTPSLVSSIERDYSTKASERSDETDVSSIGSPLEPRQPYSVPLKTHERRPPKMLGEQSSVETMRAQNTTGSWGSEGDDTSWSRSFSSGG